MGKTQEVHLGYLHMGVGKVTSNENLRIKFRIDIEVGLEKSFLICLFFYIFFFAYLHTFIVIFSIQLIIKHNQNSIHKIKTLNEENALKKIKIAGQILLKKQYWTFGHIS